MAGSTRSKKNIPKAATSHCKLSLWSIFLFLSTCLCSATFYVSWYFTENWIHPNLDEIAGARMALPQRFDSSPVLKKDEIIDNSVATNDHHSKENVSVRRGSLYPDSSLGHLIDRTQRVQVPDRNRTLAFVHVGKSGGSTISLLLRNGCIGSADGEPCEERRWEKFPGMTGKFETIASQRIQFYLHTPHVESGKLPEHYSRVTSVVVVARDPLDRFVSAFLSRHPYNIEEMRLRNKKIRLYAQAKGEPIPVWAKHVWGPSKAEANEEQRAAFFGCYPNLEEFAFCLDQRPVFNKVYDTELHWSKRQKGFHKHMHYNCTKLCADIMQGKSDYIHHLRWNYQSFFKPLSSEKEVFVIRTKHLWNDWIVVNNMLGAKNDVAVPEKDSVEGVVNERGSLSIKNNLSVDGKKILCRYLMDEFRIYVNLLNRAINLSDNEVQSSLADAHENCPEALESL